MLETKKWLNLMLLKDRRGWKLLTSLVLMVKQSKVANMLRIDVHDTGIAVAVEEEVEVEDVAVIVVVIVALTEEVIVEIIDVSGGHQKKSNTIQNKINLSLKKNQGDKVDITEVVDEAVDVEAVVVVEDSTGDADHAVQVVTDLEMNIHLRMKDDVRKVETQPKEKEKIDQEKGHPRGVLGGLEEDQDVHLHRVLETKGTIAIQSVIVMRMEILIILSMVMIVVTVTVITLAIVMEIHEGKTEDDMDVSEEVVEEVEEEGRTMSTTVLIR